MDTNRVLIITIISLLLTSLFFKLNSGQQKPNKPQVLSDYNFKNSTKKTVSNNTSNSPNKSIIIEPKTDTPLHKNSAGVSLAVNILMTAKEQNHRLNEIIQIANEHTEDNLIQALALNLCSNVVNSNCELEKIANRLLKADENNAYAKQFLALHHLKLGNDTASLEAIEEISEDDNYQSFDTHWVNAISNDISHLQSFQQDLIYLNQQSGMDINNIKPLYTAMKVRELLPMKPAKVFQKCIKMIDGSTDNERWAKACNSFGKSMKRSTTFFEQGLSLSLQKKVLSNALNPDLTAINRLDSEIQKNENISRSATEFIYGNPESSEIKQYLKDLKKFGEIKAAERILTNE